MQISSQQFKSAVISVATGIIVVLLVQGVTFIDHRIKRNNEIDYIRTFFKDHESEIKNIQGAQDGRYTRESAQFAYHKAQMRVASIIVSARSSHLNDEQSFEIIKIIVTEIDFIEFLSSENGVPEDKFYDQFFDKLRELEWLKF